MGDDAALAQRAITALIEATVFSHPSGKQNSFAAFNLPDFLMIEVSPKNIPVSYANAFLKPIHHTSRTSLVEESVLALSDYAQRLRKKFSLGGASACLTVTDTTIDGMQAMDSIDDLVEWTARQITEAQHG